MNYTIKEFRMIPTEKLYPGEAASQFASDDDDRDVIATSQEEVGTLQPLIVCDEFHDGRYCVLDGLGRLQGAITGSQESMELPCIIVECDDPRTLALYINSAGRKRTTGSRVLCFLLANKERVMQAYEATAYASKGGCRSHDRHPLQKGSIGTVPDELKPWTVKGISKRLRVSEKDVTGALDLMMCRETLTYPSRATVGRHAAGETMTDAEDIEALDKAYTGVMCGRTPVRRWAAAFAGRVTNEGKGKADTDYAALAERTAASLFSVFENWGKAQWETRAQREKVETKLAAAFAIMPECCRIALIDQIPQSWGPHERQALVKVLTKK